MVPCIHLFSCYLNQFLLHVPYFQFKYHVHRIIEQRYNFNILTSQRGNLVEIWRPKKCSARYLNLQSICALYLQSLLKVKSERDEEISNNYCVKWPNSFHIGVIWYGTMVVKLRIWLKKCIGIALKYTEPLNLWYHRIGLACS